MAGHALAGQLRQHRHVMQIKHLFARRRRRKNTVEWRDLAGIGPVGCQIGLERLLAFTHHANGALVCTAQALRKHFAAFLKAVAIANGLHMQQAINIVRMQGAHHPGRWQYRSSHGLHYQSAAASSAQAGDSSFQRWRMASSCERSEMNADTSSGSKWLPACAAIWASASSTLHARL